MSGARVFERLAETFGKRLRNDCPYLLEEPLTISCLNVSRDRENVTPKVGKWDRENVTPCPSFFMKHEHHKYSR